MKDILVTLLVSQPLTPLIVVIPQLLNILVVAVIPTKSGVSVTPVNTKLLQPKNIVAFELLSPRNGPHFSISRISNLDPVLLNLNPVTSPLIVIVYELATEYT
jgi:hypothetical protein